MKTLRSLFIVSPFLVLLPLFALASDAQRTKKLIEVLQSNAPLFEKARACQQLGEIGSPEAVPALAVLLRDEKLSAYARSGLENIPDRSAGAALRQAARELKGPLLAGVVNSLGVLRGPRAVALLSKLATDPGSGVTHESLMALGNISSKESIRVVENALERGPETSHASAAAALLVAAERQRLSPDDDLDKAFNLYQKLLKPEMSAACRGGAARGVILSRKAQAQASVFKQFLESPDIVVRNAALLTARETPTPAIADVLNDAAQRGTAESRVQVLLALSDCHNPKSLGIVQASSSDKEPEVRLAALNILPKFGPGAAGTLLRALGDNPKPEEKNIIMAGIRGLQGAEVDSLLLQSLKSSSTPAAKVDTIRLLEARGAASAAGELAANATAAEKEVSLAALSALGNLGSQRDLPSVIRIAREAADRELGAAAETAAVGICSRCGDPCSDIVLQELRAETSAGQRSRWIRILAGIGYSKALPVLESAASDSDVAVARTALEQLGRWPDPTPVEKLLDIASSNAENTLRKAALSSAIDLSAVAADEKQRPEAEIVKWMTQANSAAQSTEEKRRILGVLGRLKTEESFRLMATYVQDPNLHTEAASGLLGIAPALTAKKAAAGFVKATLQKVADGPTSPELKKRASDLAKKMPD